MSKPTDDAIVLAMLATGSKWYSSGTYAADQVATALRHLGHDVTAQQVAAWLMRLSREDLPMIEVLDSPGWREYRVTQAGRTQIGNHWPGLTGIQRFPAALGHLDGSS